MGAAKLRDMSFVLPLAALYAVGAWGLVPELVSELHRPAHTFTVVLIVSQCATLGFMALQIVLFITRRLPERKTSGVLPRIAAVVGSNSGFAFLFLQRVQQSPWMLTVSTSIITVGLAGSIFALASLGKSFSILPQARGLVTEGPYRFVRHPLYLAEQVTTFGIMCSFAQPGAFLVALGSLGVQIYRMHCEERVLADTYKEYDAYIARTSRLIPGIY